MVVVMVLDDYLIISLHQNHLPKGGTQGGEVTEWVTIGQSSVEIVLLTLEKEGL